MRQYVIAYRPWDTQYHYSDAMVSAVTSEITSVSIICPAVCSGADKNKANLRDLIAATGLVILLKLDSNRRF